MPELAKSIGRWTATGIVMGAMIGSGILLLPATMLGFVPSPWWVVAIFVLGALITIVGGLVVAEMASMYPDAGGQYVYLREAFGGFMAFLYGWGNFWLIISATIAGIAIGFAQIMDGMGLLNRILPFDAPSAGTPLRLAGWNTGIQLPPWDQAFVAVALILILTAFNYFGSKYGGLISNISTAAKTLGFVGLVLLVITFGSADGAAFADGDAGNGGYLGLGDMFIPALGSALILALFAYDGWYAATYVAGEVRNPKRDVPFALIFGPLAVGAVYIAVTLAMMFVVGVDEARSLPANQNLASIAAGKVFGASGYTWISALALVSLFGTVNAFVLAGPRISYALAKDTPFLPGMDNVNRSGVPGRAILLQGFWASVLVFTGLFDELATMAIFGVFAFHIPTALAHVRLRSLRPNQPRPFRSPLGPVLPVLFALVAGAVVLATFTDYATQAVLSLVLLASGVPAYVWLKKTRKDQEAGVA